MTRAWRTGCLGMPPFEMLIWITVGVIGGSWLGCGCGRAFADTGDFVDLTIGEFGDGLEV